MLLRIMGAGAATGHLARCWHCGDNEGVRGGSREVGVGVRWQPTAKVASGAVPPPSPSVTVARTRVLLSLILSPTRDASAGRVNGVFWSEGAHQPANIYYTLVAT